MLLKNIDLLDEAFVHHKNCYVGIEGKRIDYVGKQPPKKQYGRVYDGTNKVLLPGLVNAHSHASMTLLRGYAENLKLQDWLHQKIFPFEDKMQGEDIYNGAMLAFAEMIRFGTVSVTDMYFIGEHMARAVLDAGIKCNFSVGLTCFEDKDLHQLPIYQENLFLLENYHNVNDGQLKIDLSIHGEYTSNPKIVQQTVEFGEGKGLNMHIHLSETKTEHEQCKERNKKTPTEYFYALKLFDMPTTAAHCVWLEGEDFDILKESDVTVACCPISNFKLGSGFCNVPKLISEGVKIALGTDSAASNNNLNLFEEMKGFCTVYNAAYDDVLTIKPIHALKAATAGGFAAQGRNDCGKICVGARADFIVLDLQKPWMQPCHHLQNNLVYSTQGSDVVLTVVDGKVLYEEGEYTTIDIEKVIYNANKSTQKIINQLR